MKTPANDNLFQVRKRTDAVVLSKHGTGQFHSTIVKLLFLAKWGIPDILLAVLFLTTRLKSPKMDGCKKLMRVLGYLRGTIDYDVRIFGKPTLVHRRFLCGAWRYEGHSGAILSIGGNVILSRSNKQKVNAQSSTEAELIAVPYQQCSGLDCLWRTKDMNCKQ